MQRVALHADHPRQVHSLPHRRLQPQQLKDELLTDTASL
jgi:hypothetical protein